MTDHGAGTDARRGRRTVMARLLEHVRRIVFLVAATFVVANTTGLLPEGDETACCDGKQCPPTCPSCTCAWHSITTAPVAIFEVPAIALMDRAVELPTPRAGDGQRAPAPSTRPPIA